MQIASETLLKLQILTHGVAFTPAALTESIRVRAKGQNLVYNAPINFLTDRPQELFLTGPDGYCTVVSCVAPTSEHTVQIDIDKDRTLHAVQDGIRFVDVMLTFVQEPAYYMRTISNGDQVKQYVTACGYDELNIIPWKGCCIGRICKFCGSNITARYNRLDMTTAVGISHNLQAWYAQEAEYLAHLAESVSIAIQDPCYAEHAHIILISGNLSSPQLDEQASIYSRIAQTIRPLVAGKSPEGIVAVITPPHDLLRLSMLRDAGIDVVVFNLEVGTEPWFTKYCPGKSALGREFFLERLYAAVDVFGRGKVWTNFVLGLEPVDDLLAVCRTLALDGIVPSANVLHFDEGNQIDCAPPSLNDVAHFFIELNRINCAQDFRPYYCAKALRTSLTNEAFAQRLSPKFLGIKTSSAQ